VRPIVQNVKKPYQKVELSGGRNGDCTVTYDFSDLNLYEQQEVIDPIPYPPRKKRQGRYSVPLTHIPQEQWEDVAQRHATGESFRQLGRSFGVSHEAIRQIVLNLREHETDQST
jgi:hypothetical protein